MSVLENGWAHGEWDACMLAMVSVAAHRPACLPAGLPTLPTRVLGALHAALPCRDNKADTQDDKAFDLLTRELVFEAKAKPGERTLTGGACT